MRGWREGGRRHILLSHSVKTRFGHADIEVPQLAGVCLSHTEVRFTDHRELHRQHTPASEKEENM